MKNIKDKFLYPFLFFLFVAIDLLSKYYFSNQANEFRNYVFAFSLNVPIILIYVVYILLLGGLGWWFWKKQNKNWKTKIGFTLVMAGAVSNIAERIYLGYVRDFIHIHTGIFNVADFMIILGILFLFIES